MRENLFRGKTYKTSVFDKTDWVYGSLIDSGNHEQVDIYPWHNGASTMSVRQLVYARMEAVKPETVGQFTGIPDKNGKLIYEGDIVKSNDRCFVAVVRWRADRAAFDLEIYYKGIPDDSLLFIPSIVSGLEVIGNIHDNPDLLQDERTWLW